MNADSSTNSPMDEFQDPLDNYDPPEYDDPLEKALAEKSVAAIHSFPFTAVSPDTPIHQAIKILSGLEIRCLLIAEEDRLVGILSERDILDRLAEEFDHLKDHPVREIMTSNPVALHTNDSAAAALCAMAVGGYRHVPVLDLDEKLVGIVSPRRVTAFLQDHLDDD